MAHFEKASGDKGKDFDPKKAPLALPKNNRRAICLWGGKDLKVKDRHGLLKIHEWLDPRPDYRLFWLDGIGDGMTDLQATTADGKDYAAFIQIVVTGSIDLEEINKARSESQRTLREAIGKLDGLIAELEAHLRSGSAISLSPENLKTLQCAIRWLNLPPPARIGSSANEAIKKARDLMKKNLELKDIPFVRTPDGFHGNKVNEKVGLEFGELFFTVDGPNCRRDVVTHEHFHLLGIHHGKSDPSGATTGRTAFTTEECLDSADNLAQMVADITTGRTDCCTRPRD